ncbi:uncharacterized protein GGS22DRAFT_56290 [Annulohypoxylon maeteangense]|uniref:uncharacterized protein n=1 Tax=Annulohypoxylon maeteangense TaxID=1927788 RepID=UPI002008D0B1|nr:uncharacterized protein GGS22DRAFT_56290 [Annulohypoxylon maeteangense]KAI0881784.1 hypothetical protein GGS22DRAFT_56290 [Annulohypoxylon maeteangense]
MSGAIEDSLPSAGQGEISTPSSLSGQKRPRDYGEQLKGLSQSDDEGAYIEKSTPASKKQKTDNFNNSDDSDLDDGEIVESSPSQPSRAIASQDMELNTASNTTSKTHDIGINTFEPSEDGEIDSSMADDLDKPFFIDTTGAAGTTPSQHAGWNQGVSVGARTSFGKPATQLFPVNASTSRATLSSESSRHIHEAKDEEDDDEDEDYDDPKDRDYQAPPSPTTNLSKDAVKPESKPQLVFSVEGATWILPHQAFKVRKRNVSDNKAFWDARLYPWILALAEANEGMADRISVEIVKTGMIDHAKRKGADGLLTGSNKHVTKIRAVAQEVLENTDLNALILKARNSIQRKKTQASEGKTPGKKSIAADGSIQKETVAPISNGTSSDEELRLQRRYFPFAKDPSIFCLCCNGVGHKTSTCPLLQCKFCGSKEHGMFACPTRRRCSKCRQLGHNTKTCNEKLALAPEEQDECAFCGGKHLDKECTEIWRTYKVIPGQQKKVKDIPAFCYTCGGSGHYGSECGLPDKGGNATERTSWSQANRNLYVDPNSENIALAWVGIESNPSSETDIRIRGTAKKQVHTHFVSDDSDEDLVHAPIQRPEPRGQIRISSNIGSVGQGNNRGRGGRRNYDQSRRRQNEREFSPPPPPPLQGNGAAWQPPLPPGPPPRNSNRYERPLAPPPGSLPPRPQTYDSRPSRGGSSNRGGQNNQGSRGGFRGGGRGGGGRGGGRGGRGRGRGK